MGHFLVTLLPLLSVSGHRRSMKATRVRFPPGFVQQTRQKQLVPSRGITDRAGQTHVWSASFPDAPAYKLVLEVVPDLLTQMASPSSLCKILLTFLILCLPTKGK